MLRWILVPTVLAAGIVAVAAHSDLIDQRVELMEKQGQTMGLLTKIARGEISYDQAKVDEAFATLKESAAKLPTLFPPTAKGQAADSDYYASDKVWENKADFDAQLQKLIKAIDENAAKAKSADSLKDARAAIGKVCGDCHETYRVKKS